MKATNFPALIQRFFTDRLSTQMEASRHTVAGYRDTFRLLIRYASSRCGKPPTKLTIEDLDADLVADFLTHGLCCTNPVRDSSCESSVVAVIHDQTQAPDLQDQELASL